MAGYKICFKQLFVLTLLLTLAVLGSACAGEKEEKKAPAAAVQTPVAGVTPVAQVTPTVAPTPTTAAPAPVAQRFPEWLTSPAGVTRKRGGTFTYVTQSDWPHLDPALSEAAGIGIALRPIYGHLVVPAFGKTYGDYVIGDDLAQTWEMSQDGTVWTFNLRRGVKWQNVGAVAGREVVADDVIFTYNRYLEAGSAKRGLLAKVAKMEAPDKYTLKFTLKAPAWDFLGDVANAGMFIIPPETATMPGGYKENAIGYGSFILSKSVLKERNEYRKNVDYFRGDPYLDNYIEVIIRDDASAIAAFRTGKVDVIQTKDFRLVEQVIKDLPKTQVLQHPWLAWNILNFACNNSVAPYSDVKVRRAMALAIDLEGINKQVFDGFADSAMGLIPWSLALDRKPTLKELGPWHQYDPKQAKELLKAAGYPDGFEIKSPIIFFDYFGVLHAPMVELWRQQLAAVGIKSTTQKMDYTTYTGQIYEKKYPECAHGFHSPGGPTASYHFSTYFLSTSPRNNARINDPELDKMIMELSASFDQARRSVLTRQIWDRMYDQVYVFTTPMQAAFELLDPAVRQYRNSISGSPHNPSELAIMWVDR